MYNDSLIAEVAVEGLVYHIDAPFTYLIPENLNVLAGERVLVPFGNGNKKKQGFVLNVKSRSETDEGIRLKSIAAVLDEVPLLNDEMLSLVTYLKENTFCTLFEAAKAMLPSGIGLDYVVSFMADENVSSTVIEKLTTEEKAVYDFLKDGCKFQKKEKILSSLGFTADSVVLEKLEKKGVLVSNLDTRRRIGDLTVKNVRLAISEDEAQSKLSSLTAKQRSVLSLLIDIGSASVKEVCYFTGVTVAVVTALCKKGYLELFDSEVYRKPKITAEKSITPIPALTENQEKAYKYLSSKIDEGKAGAALLFGVTGSGKTQVFIKLIEKVVRSGKGVIVMVPEIALTPQTINIFYSYFGDTVAVFHSALSAGERIDEWKRVKNGDARIAIGTRSAIFAPFDNLGLIVMDEEHEHTYKSEMTPRFHARDIAKFRCVKNDAFLLLSSATPSIESYKNAQDGKYGFVKLTERFGKAVLPEVKTVDISNSKGVISNELYSEIEEVLADKKQAILLMNRRGFNTFATCESCKSVVTCPNCSISLTYHNANNRLMCHYCGYSMNYTDVCPTCNNKSIKYAGFGTQRIEDDIENIFPNAKVLRMDADTTMAKYSYEEKLQAFAKGEYDILLGTQMVAKGLNFPKVTLVGVISIDQQLYNDDFRSSEKAFDLLTQVVGRSGRGDFKGKAVIQTMLPDNDIITLASEQDYEGFFEMENVIRKAMLYPPYCDICSLTFVSENYAKCSTSANRFLDLLKSAVTTEYADVKVNVLGPLQPKVSKINNKFRNIITIKCKNNKRFRSMISSLLVSFMKDKMNSGVSVITDMNPLS
ncbi:MAG: primosomal protein N' [Ruminococcaceae bacterium]|nr:primosomal protein N' [Oscillospiraceae bacterium]